MKEWWEHDPGPYWAGCRFEECVHAQGHLLARLQDHLGWCGCGQPWFAYSLLRDLLALLPWHTDKNWEKAEALCGAPGAFYIVAYHLEDRGLTLHGGSVGGSWITDAGTRALHLLQSVPDFEDVSVGEDGLVCSACPGFQGSP